MGWLCCYVAGGGCAGASPSSPDGVAPRAAIAAPVRTSPGSLWLAAQALPCHANQMSTWAMVSVISSSLLFFFSGHDLWPSGQDQ
jgi:hypothetical protein